MEKTTRRVEIDKLLQNLQQISSDVAAVSGHLRGAEAEKTYDLIHRLIWRLDGLDAATIKKFLQEEGIKAKLF
jgi:phospholipid/cholesterol/gamma-HCH transport system substrate-binding protein